MHHSLYQNHVKRYFFFSKFEINVTQKKQIIYLIQRLIKKQIKITTLFKTKIDRLTILNDNDFSQSLKSFKNFSNESIITNFVIQKKILLSKSLKFNLINIKTKITTNTLNM